MKHWRTTLGGILAAFGTVVTLLPIPFAAIIGATLTAAGQAILGLAAPDKTALAKGNNNRAA